MFYLRLFLFSRLSYSRIFGNDVLIAAVWRLAFGAWRLALAIELPYFFYERRSTSHLAHLHNQPVRAEGLWFYVNSSSDASFAGWYFRRVWVRLKRREGEFRRIFSYSSRICKRHNIYREGKMYCQEYLHQHFLFRNFCPKLESYAPSSSPSPSPPLMNKSQHEWRRVSIIKKNFSSSGFFYKLLNGCLQICKKLKSCAFSSKIQLWWFWNF